MKFVYRFIPAEGSLENLIDARARQNCQEYIMSTNRNMEPEGQTPIDPDECAGLKIKSITTQAELREFEQII